MEDYNFKKLNDLTSNPNNIYIQHIFDATPPNELKSIFSSDENIIILTHKFMKDLCITDKHLIISIKNSVKQYISNWINLGKFDYPVQAHDALSTIEYYNSLFIEVFRDEIKKNNKYNSNPFLEIINGKKRSQFTPDDYNRLNVQQSQTIYSREVLNKNKVPFYEKAMYKHHFDTTNDNTLVTHGNDRVALSYTFNVDHPKLDKLDTQRDSTANTGFERETLLYNKFSDSDLKLLI